MSLHTLHLVSSLAIGTIQTFSVEVGLQLAYNQPLTPQAPPGVSDDRRFNDREFAPTNSDFLLLVPPSLEGGIGPRRLLSSVKEPPAGAAPRDSLYYEFESRNERVAPSLLEELRRFEQSGGWQIGGGGLFSYGSRSQTRRLMIHCGPSFKPPREAFEGERCFGLLLRFDLGRHKSAR